MACGMPKTRRARKSGGTRRVRRVGGAGASLPNLPASPVSPSRCAADLVRMLPDDYDYERMKDNDSNNIDSSKSYEEFVEDQRARASSLSPDDCAFLQSLLERVAKRGIKSMDMEYANAHSAQQVFLDMKNRPVVVLPR